MTDELLALPASEALAAIATAAFAGVQRMSESCDAWQRRPDAGDSFAPTVVAMWPEIHP